MKIRERLNDVIKLISLMILKIFEHYCKKEKLCTSRESNPGHIDGNDVSYHWTTSAKTVAYPDNKPLKLSDLRELALVIKISDDT